MLTRALERWPGALRVCARGEEGLTLPELMVAMLVSTIVTAALMFTIPTFMQSEAATVNSANSASTTRLVFLQFQSDVQSASAIGSEASASSFSNELIVTLAPSRSVVTWQYANGELTRTVGSGAAEVELAHVTNSSSNEPVFVYYDHCSDNLVAEGETVSAIQADTTVIKVTLDINDVDSAPYGSTTSVNLMDRSPGDTPCG